jgi:hypothetical protein
MTAEHQRLADANAPEASWRKFGPYLSERQWGTVREDYSAGGHAWGHCTHDMARSYAYRWGEDGLAGVSDDQQRLCLGLGLWNGQDPILKERLFGLSGPEGNHGEDVKEVYYYLDNLPTHAYMRMLYKYPQRAFPYAWLVQENARRNRTQPEFELLDTAIFHDNRYFDVCVEYAKAGPTDLLMHISVSNRGPEPATVHVLPQLWFRNTWAWGHDPYRPRLEATQDGRAIAAEHQDLGALCLYCDQNPDLLFCDNETNAPRLYGAPSRSGSTHFKDGINDYVVQGAPAAVNPAQTGTKAAAHYVLTIAAGATHSVRVRLGPATLAKPFADFDQLVHQRRLEADEYYAALQADLANEDARRVQRQAWAGMLWSKQFYYYDVPEWLAGDPATPPPPAARAHGRNAGWKHLNNADIISMPDKWEYPWYAAWDLAFHCVPLAQLDAEFAKHQLRLLCQDWYMHPNGQLPAYEWNLSDTNPPVHAWATWRVYKMCQKQHGGTGDLDFLATVFHRLLLNFTWWVNRKDRSGRNVFEGGFLGLDNIGLFDRSAPLPDGSHIEQADGTALGSHVRAEHDAHGPGAGPDPARLPGLGQQVFRALPLHRRGHDQHGRRRPGPVGRRRRVLLRRPAHPRARPAVSQNPLPGGADSALCRGSARRRGAASGAAVCGPAQLVSGQPALPGQLGVALAAAGAGRLAPALAAAWPPHEAPAGPGPRRGRVSLRLRHPVPVEIPPRPSRSPAARRPGPHPELRAGRVANRLVRGQLQLARAGVAAHQFLAH